MKDPPRLRRVVHRGSVEAHGFVVDRQSLGDEEASSRALTAWIPGTVVYEVDEGWLVWSPKAPRVRTDRAPGLPLASVSGHLVAFPASPREVAALASGSPSLVRLWHGQLQVRPLRDLEHVDPARWISLEGHQEVVCDSLGAPPDNARPSIAESPEHVLRQRFLGVPPEAPEAEDVLRSIVDQHTANRSTTDRGPSFIETMAARVRSWLDRSLQWLSGLRSRSQASGQGAGRKVASPTIRSGAFERAIVWLRARLNRAILRADLAHVIGRKKANYLDRMMTMFRRGDLDNALRHAVPLARPEDAPGIPTLGVPTPRRDLRIHTGMLRTPGVMGGGRSVYEDLAATYREAFRQLDARGEVDKAAFVLAELLHDYEEAVSYLERHGRLQLAAELAEARGFPAGAVVRLWFLAGDRKRAIAIARREGAFADAIVRLERSGLKSEAAELRLLWADLLASAGDYLAASDVVWPIPEARRLARDWIDRGIEQGGPGGARLLVRKLTLDPQAFDEVRDRAVVFLESDDPEQTAARHALVMALHDAEPGPGVRTLARAALRSVLRHWETPGPHLSPVEYRDLITLTDDGALRADLPPLPPPPRSIWLAERQSPVRLSVSGTDVGLIPVQDAALLPNGRVLLALGEAGVRLLSPAGRTIVHFEAPAHQLVLSDRGDHAIAMARRGDTWRLTRVDLARRHAETWCDARIDAVAPDYDGSVWFVATTDLLAIDATARGFESLKQIPDVSPRGLVACTRLARSSSRLSMYVVEPVPQVWAFALPSLTLRSRETVPFAVGGPAARARHIALSTEGTVVAQDWPLPAAEAQTTVTPPPGVQLRLMSASGVATAPVGREEEQPGQPVMTSEWVATWVRGPDYCRVVLLDTKRLHIRGEIRLERAQRVALRLGELFLTIGDDAGRVLLVDLADGRLVRDRRT
jgi:MoxR-vWA-beta-propeller ternary system domain bpX6